MATPKTTVAIDGHALNLSNLDKVLFPADGYTKGDLIAYYRSVAPWLVPHLEDRPLTLQRWPDGIEGPSFFEKQAPKFTPPWVKTVRADASYGSSAKQIDYILCNDEATLVFCANLAAIVLHTWYSRAGSLDVPDYTLFDLDPYECTVKTLARVALEMRDALEEIGLHPLVKTSGGSGLHVVLPLKPRYNYDVVKTFGEVAAREVARRVPKLTTIERTIAKRPKGVVYLDYVQVGMGKTVVPPLCVRARDGAPVSTPLHWAEVEELASSRGRDPETIFARWNMKNTLGRLKKEGDLWAGKGWRETALEPALKKARTKWEIG